MAQAFVTGATVCGSCPDCLEQTSRLLRPRRRSGVPGPAPTVAALERHARKHGPEQVAETAAEFGITVAVERPRPRRKATGPTLRERVARLVGDGYGVEVVAEMEDLSPARARRLVSEVQKR